MDGCSGAALVSVGVGSYKRSLGGGSMDSFEVEFPNCELSFLVHVLEYSFGTQGGH